MIRSRHTGIVVSNIKKALFFYKDILGLEIVEESTESGKYIENIVGIPNVVIKIVKLKTIDNYIIELLEYVTQNSFLNSEIGLISSDRIGCSHVAFSVSDIERMYSTLTHNGFMCNTAPQLSANGKVKVMYCHDSDGTIIEMVELI